jgi:hypothetical protein
LNFGKAEKRTAGAKALQTADKADLRQRQRAQGLKPIDSIALIGTTEVVPCYKTFLAGFFIKLRG